MSHTTWKQGLKIVSAIALLGTLWAIWTYWPLYAFVAHRGDAPLPAWGWVSVPDTPSPSSYRSFDPDYELAGQEAVQALSDWREDLGAPALSAAVAVGGDLVWQGTSGWADLAHARPASPETVFRMGSVSKALTATALAQLVQDGVVELDAPLSVHMPAPPNRDWAEMTARQLASHMAGLPHYRRNTDKSGQRLTLTLNHHFSDVRESLEVFDSSELLSPPGSRFHYSTLGTVLLGALISEASDLSYRDLITQRVLTPLGMTQTAVATPNSEGEQARYYVMRDQKFRVWRPVDLSHRLPGGGWMGTPTDLAYLGQAWLDPEFLSPTVRDSFWTPQRLNSGEVNAQNYALGWRWTETEFDTLGTIGFAHHGGVSRGAQAFLLVFPEEDMVIAFMINTKTESFAEFGLFYRELVEIFAPLARSQSERP